MRHIMAVMILLFGLGTGHAAVTESAGLEWTLDAEVRKQASPMAWIPDGAFPMGNQGGAAKGRPVHQVYLYAFYMDIYEVTTAHYAKFLAAAGPNHPDLVPMLWEQVNLASHGDRAVVGVTWKAAETYCAWAGKRLPSEAEWEKAARGADGRQYPWGNDVPTSSRANYDKPVWHDRDIYTDGLKPVGSYEAGRSPYGIYDMAGNVAEWVSDWYDEKYYVISPASNPSGPALGKQKVLRGGSFGDAAVVLQSSSRESYFPVDKGPYVGIRCAKDAF
jgi:formylglycine-generating enzyme required for sulfatase activity